MVLIDRKSKPRTNTLLSAKRTSLERKGLHSWHPYYAGYSERFVESAIDYLKCSKDTLLLDPWSGSGTTSVVASRRGIPSIGMDINPVMATFTAAKSPYTLHAIEEIRNFFSSLSVKFDKNRVLNPREPLNNILSPETALVVRRLWEFAGTFRKGSSKFNIFSSDIRSGVGPIDPAQAFIASVFFVTLRKLTASKRSTNPTWSLQVEKKFELNSEILLRELEESASLMLKNLEEFYGTELPVSREVFSLLGDACAMDIPDASIDRIITSPPYLTRIDYAISTAPELYAFGIDGLLHSIRHATTGAPVITNREKRHNPEWGPTCNRILEAVKAHPTKAAATYYWKNMVQYFEDMEKAIAEISRVLKVGGSGIIVVQSSYFKDLELPLGEIVVQLAEAQGLISHIASRDVVKTHMAHVNTRSSKYVSNKVYFEDAVHIRK